MRERAQKILVTGSGGFLGSAFTDFLDAKGVSYIRYDRNHPEQTPRDFDAVVHFGGLTPQSPSNGTPFSWADYERANIEGTRQVLALAASNKHLKRFVNIGSAAEYGLAQSAMSEKTKEAPVGDYGKSKLQQSKLVEEFAHTHKVPVYNLRLFNIVGVPKNRRTLLTPQTRVSLFERFVYEFSKKRVGTITISNNNDVRDYVDIEDVMEAIYAALCAKKKAPYQVINIASGHGVSIGRVLEMFGRVTNKTYRVKNASPKKTSSMGNAGKAQKLLGWSATTSLEESVQKLFGVKKRVIIVGAGVGGKMLVEEIEKENRLDIFVVGFVDDDKKKQGKVVYGIPVVGTIADLPSIIARRRIDQVFISTPSVGKELVTRVTDLLPAGFSIKILPSISRVILGKVDLSYVRDIDISDLIGRPLVKSDQRFISSKAKGKTFLVTGGAGSIGSEIVRQLYGTDAKCIVVVDAWEEGVFNLSEELKAAQNGQRHPELHLHIGNVRDKKRVDEIMKRFKPDAIFHAAAYKHVPLMEDHPEEAYKTNVVGTKNLLDLAVKYRSKEFLLISTDKAVKPTSVMGKTKRAAELVLRRYARAHPRFRFSAVRFGNVLNSSGSVIPTFVRQIRTHSSVTITHRDMTRYFMSIPEAVSLVLISSIIAENGQILILDMGEQVKILDLAERLIKMHGLEPHRDIPIEEIGIRPGEKIHEELAYNTDMLKQSSMPRIFVAEELE